SVPDVPTLRLMTELATSMLPFGAMLAGLQGPVNLRLVLTGPGGGTWDVVIGGGGPQPGGHRLRTHLVDFCRPAAHPRARPRRPRHARHRRPEPGGRRAGAGLGAGARLTAAVPVVPD